MAKLPDLIRRRREATGHTQTSLAAAAGISIQQIQKIEAGKVKNINKGAKEMAEALGISDEEWARAAAEDKKEELFGGKPNARLVPRGVTRNPRGGDIPVIGRAAASGEMGRLGMLNEIVGYIQRPPELDSVEEGFAVHVYGDSMEPRYYHGERIYVDPLKDVRRGDFCVVQVGNPLPEFAYIKRFIAKIGGILILEQFNPPKEFKIPMKEVHSIGRIVGSGSA